MQEFSYPEYLICTGGNTSVSYVMRLLSEWRKCKELLPLLTKGQDGIMEAGGKTCLIFARGSNGVREGSISGKT